MSIREKLPSLAELRRKINEASKQDAPQDDSATPASMSMGLRVGIELVAGVAVGGVMGYGLDHWAGTMPLFFINYLLS